jgi:PPE-repeat protein
VARLLDTLTINAFISFGVILGGTLIGSLGAVFTGQSPGHSMVELAGKLKIWALVSALGGTFDMLKAIEAGFLGMHLSSVAKQVLMILSAFLGAHTGYMVILWLTGNRSQ